jgi:hypothetical protein
MTVFLCIDEQNGMMFNNRRQSRDSAVIDKIITLSSENEVFTSEYTQKILNNGNICNDFTNFKGYAFIEDPDDIIEDKIKTLYLFKWNRHYPSDKKLNIDFNNFKLIHCEDFIGLSHENITLEKYIRKENIHEEK